MGSMPIDLVLVRHGQSEGNLAQQRSSNGDSSDWSGDFVKRHSSQYRLTDYGRQQAKLTGEFIKKTFGQFDRYYVSEYARARETAGLLGLEGEWYVDIFLREQDMGVLGSKSKEHRKKEYAHELERKKLDPFYWAPMGGESVANTCLRVNRVLSQLRRECPGFKIILVCHGNIMDAFNICIEKYDAKHYMEMKDKSKRFNCQIIHYTRRDPKTGIIHPHLEWKRVFVPWEDNLVDSSWQKISRPVFTEKQLIDSVNMIPQLVNN